MEPMDKAGAPAEQQVKPQKKGKKKSQPTEGAQMDQTAPGTDATPKTPRPRVSKNFAADATIKILSEKNPKRPSSKSYARFDLYRNGMTVAEFIKAGGMYGDLSWDADRRFIEVSGYTPPERPVKAEPAPVPA